MRFSFKNVLFIFLLLVFKPSYAQVEQIQLKPSVSLFFDEATSDFGIGLGVHNPGFEAEATFSIDGNDPNYEDNFMEIPVGGNIGIVRQLGSNVSAALGAMGSYTFTSSADKARKDGFEVDPHTMGVYVGLYYKPNNIFEIFIQSMPASYELEYDGSREIEGFQKGKIGARYYF